MLFRSEANERIILRYYVTDDTAAAVFPKGVTKAGVADPALFPPALYEQTVASALKYMAQKNIGVEYKEDLDEYLRYIQRERTRMNLLRTGS